MAKWTGLLLLMLVPAGLCQNCTTDPCVKDCTGCGPGQFIADPEDCHRYYVCDGNGNLQFNDPLYCEHGEVFDITIRECQSGAQCNVCQRKCYYQCAQSPNNLISYFYDCGSYYECDSAGIPGPVQNCPADKPFFDGIDCQADERRCCHCHPYCYDGDQGKYVADPKDCRNYYACFTQGIPSGQGHCSPGEFFETDACSSHATCNTICKNVIDYDGCIDPYTCLETGYFPKCPSKCVPQYYFCPQVSNTYVEAEECPVGYDFHPDLHVCVRTEDCPY
ncbi:hypothetical protein O3P69_019437 [Scylla paramamosain]|uniref:Chitin-binding type-2 domain-containing protein n=1 Tax=Scylla paramamosain TaxID=85552 RepID=A0AAW0SWQ4_SCYPA